jgi:hypothetical protein
MPTIVNGIVGFQRNALISAGLWVYRPDSGTIGKEIVINVDAAQYIQASMPDYGMPEILSTSVSNNILTVVGANNFKPFQMVGITGATTSVFLNNHHYMVLSATPTQFTTAFTYADYSDTPETGAVINCAARKVWFYYAQTNYSTSQEPLTLEGVPAQQFMFDLELLFTTAGSAPYVVGGSFLGQPDPGQVILVWPFTESVLVRAGMPASQGVVTDAPTIDAVFQIFKGAIQVGTMTFRAGVKVATFSSPSDTTFTAGEVVFVYAPNPQDSTLKNIGLAIAGVRV